MEISCKVRSVHFRKAEHSFGLDCDLSFLLKFVNGEEELVVRIYDSILEGNHVSIEKINEEEFHDHEKNLSVGSKSSACRYIISVLEDVMDSEIDLKKDDIENELESTLLSASVDFNKELQDYE